MADNDRRPDGRIFTALGLLTFGTGVVDAASVLGLGRVFTANMTGNVVFLGFALAGAGNVAISHCVLALVAFLVGALAGGWLGGKGAPFALALGLELTVMAAASALAWTLDVSSRPAIEIALLALAMGVHNASVRKLAIPDMTTTVLTLTLTGLAADSSLAGGKNPRWARRLTSAVLMLAGALAGALLLRHGVRWTITAATAIVACALVVVASAREREGVPAPAP